MLQTNQPRAGENSLSGEVNAKKWGAGTMRYSPSHKI